MKQTKEWFEQKTPANPQKFSTRTNVISCLTACILLSNSSCRDLCSAFGINSLLLARFHSFLHWPVFIIFLSVLFIWSKLFWRWDSMERMLSSIVFNSTREGSGEGARRSVVAMSLLFAKHFEGEEYIYARDLQRPKLAPQTSKSMCGYDFGEVFPRWGLSGGGRRNGTLKASLRRTSSFGRLKSDPEIEPLATPFARRPFGFVHRSVCHKPHSNCQNPWMNSYMTELVS